MKTFLLTLLFASTFHLYSNGQVVDDVYGGSAKTDKRADKYGVDNVHLPLSGSDIIFEKVYEYKGVEKSKIYNLAREYFVKNAGNSNYTGRVDDINTGTYIAKGNQKVKGIDNWELVFQFDVKDEKIRFRVSQIVLDEGYSTLLGHMRTPIEQIYKNFDSARQKNKRSLSVRSWANRLNNLSEFVDSYISDAGKHITNGSDTDF